MVVLLDLFIVLLLFCLLLFIVMQILIPLKDGTPFFPMFRQQLGTTRSEIVYVEQEIDDEVERARLRDLKAQLESLKDGKK